MTNTTNLKLKLSAACFVLGLACSTALGIEVIDIGTLGGSYSVAYAINEADQVVGSCEPGDFLWEEGQTTLLPNVRSPGGINNSGQIACGVTASDGIMYPGMAEIRKATDVSVEVLGTLGGTTSGWLNGYALAINSSGVMVGFSYINTLQNHSFLFDQNGMHDIGLFSQENSYATAINDSGAVVGVSDSKGFIYANGGIQRLFPFGSTDSVASAINNSGQVVGQYLTADQTSRHGFVYTSGVFADIGITGNEYTGAEGINDLGQVVGTTYVTPAKNCRGCNREFHAFLYENGLFTDLNTLLPSGSGWVLAYGYAINNKGHIVGAGYHNGQLHAFMLKLHASQARLPQPAHLDGRKTAASCR